jgi:uncharacterized protein (DUF2267 family)
MADRQLRTRDLAGTPDAGGNAEHAPDPEQRGAPADDGEGLDETTSASEVEGADEELEPSSNADADPGPTATAMADDEREPLLPGEQSDRFTAQWQEIQASFVDRPRESVEQADTLVADLMQRLAAGFSDERERLEAQWDRGDDVSTEDLRVALTRYRSFFDRLLSA